MPRLRRDSVTWLIYVQLGVYGYFLYGFSPVVPLLRDEQHVSRGVASLHSTALAAGAPLGGAAFPALSRRLGRGATMWLGLAGVALGVVSFCALRPIAATLASTLFTASFGTLLLSGVVAALGERHGPAGPAAIAEANALACGLGAVAPLVIGATVAAGLTWRPGLAVVVVLIGLVALAALIFRVRLPDRRTAVVLTPEPIVVPVPPPPATHPGRPPAPGQPPAPGRLPAAYWLAWLLMSCTGSVEVCLNLWASDVLRSRAGLSPGAAATVVSGIVGGMCLSRIIGSRVALRVPAPRLLLIVLAVSLAGFALFWTSTAPVPAVAGLILCGLGNGMHYPLAIGIALRLCPGQEDRAASRASYTMAIGFGLAPLALGAVADRIGAHGAFVLVPAFLAGAAVLAGWLVRRLPAPAGVSPLAAPAAANAPA
jgi:fucose permease